MSLLRAAARAGAALENGTTEIDSKKNWSFIHRWHRFCAQAHRRFLEPRKNTENHGRFWVIAKYRESKPLKLLAQKSPAASKAAGPHPSHGH